MRALLATLLVLAAALATAAVPAAAQSTGPSATLSLTVVDPARAFEPGSEGTLDVYGRYGVRQAAGAPNPDIEGDGQQPTRITFEVAQMPSWVLSAVVEPSEKMVYPPVQGPLGGQQPFDGIVVRLNVSPDAPALQREDIVIRAHAEENGAIPSATAESPAIKLRAAEVPDANVTGPASPFVMDGGQWTIVPFEVRNDGNKDTKFLLNVTIRPENSEVEFPQEVDLAIGETASIEVRIRTPWTERETGTLELEAVPLTEDDVGPAARYAVDVVGESAVPTLGPLGTLAAVGAAIVLRRRAA